MSRRWLDDEQDHAPGGLLKVGYDADRNVWTYKDPSDGSMWEGGPHRTLSKVEHQPFTNRLLPYGMKLSTPRCHQQQEYQAQAQAQQQYRQHHQHQHHSHSHSHSQYHHHHHQQGSRTNSTSQASAVNGSEDGIISPSSPSSILSPTSPTSPTSSSSPYTPTSPYSRLIHGSSGGRGQFREETEEEKDEAQYYVFTEDGEKKSGSRGSVGGAMGKRASRMWKSVANKVPFGQKKHSSIVTAAATPSPTSPTTADNGYSYRRGSSLASVLSSPAAATTAGSKTNSPISPPTTMRQSKRKTLMRPFRRSKDFEAPDDMSGAVDYNNYMDFTRSAGPLSNPASPTSTSAISPTSPTDVRRMNFGGPLVMPPPPTQTMAGGRSMMEPESPSSVGGGFGVGGSSSPMSPRSSRLAGQEPMAVGMGSSRVATIGQPRLNSVVYGQPTMNSVAKGETAVRISVVENPFDDASDEEVSGRP